MLQGICPKGWGNGSFEVTLFNLGIVWIWHAGDSRGKRMASAFRKKNTSFQVILLAFFLVAEFLLWVQNA